MKKWLHNILYGYFHFNRQEVNGLFVLMVILCIALAVRISIPYLLPSNGVVEVAKIDWDKLAAADSVNQLAQKRSFKADTFHREMATVEYSRFVFDPNTISAAEAVQLGFTEKTAKTLVNFRSKGGKFRQPADLKKLYGISEALYSDLEPYILIAAQPAFKKDSAYRAWPKKYPEKKAYHIELNSADSAAIVMLKGIGPSLTKRILKYRSMLGGFYSTSQLKEVYGMPDSTLQVIAGSISVDPQLITRIQVNKIEFNELRKHPYLTFQVTQAIINYRTKHGALTPENIKSIAALDPEKLQRLMPYLSFQ